MKMEGLGALAGFSATLASKWLPGHRFDNGFEGPGQIDIYSIIGNKIIETSTQDMFQYKLMSPLELGHMYIIRVTTNGKAKTFKLIAS